LVGGTSEEEITQLQPAVLLDLCVFLQKREELLAASILFLFLLLSFLLLLFPFFLSSSPIMAVIVILTRPPSRRPARTLTTRAADASHWRRRPPSSPWPGLASQPSEFVPCILESTKSSLPHIRVVIVFLRPHTSGSMTMRMTSAQGFASFTLPSRCCHYSPLPLITLALLHEHVKVPHAATLVEKVLGHIVVFGDRHFGRCVLFNLLL